MDERSSEDLSFDNEETSSRRIHVSINKEGLFNATFERINEEEVSTSNIFRDSTSRRNLEKSTYDRLFKDTSSDEEDEHVCLKVSEEDSCEVTTLSYNQLFK